MPTAPQAGASATSSSDIFLHVQTKRAGKVKGEAMHPGHEDDIVVKGWSWGVSTTSALGSTQAASRRAYKGLTIFKQIDSATTALMAALVTNDEVKEAKLTMRKAGSEQMDYFLVTLQKARISSVDHTTDAAGNTTETVTLQFNKVSVEYRPQKTAGSRGASMTFEDEILNN